jgi:hypothetical protein
MCLCSVVYKAGSGWFDASPSRILCVLMLWYPLQLFINRDLVGRVGNLGLFGVSRAHLSLSILAAALHTRLAVVCGAYIRLWPVRTLPAYLLWHASTHRYMDGVGEGYINHIGSGHGQSLNVEPDSTLVTYNDSDIIT